MDVANPSKQSNEVNPYGCGQPLKTLERGEPLWMWPTPPPPATKRGKIKAEKTHMCSQSFPGCLPGTGKLGSRAEPWDRAPKRAVPLRFDSGDSVFLLASKQEATPQREAARTGPIALLQHLTSQVPERLVGKQLWANPSSFPHIRNMEPEGQGAPLHLGFALVPFSQLFWGSPLLK